MIDNNFAGNIPMETIFMELFAKFMNEVLRKGTSQLNLEHIKDLLWYVKRMEVIRKPNI